MAAVLRRPVSAAFSSASNNTTGKLSSTTTTTTSTASHVGRLHTASAMSSSSPAAAAAAPPEDPRDSQTCTLPDGRTLGFAEYGAADGRPLIYLHGFPSCRLEGAAADALARRHKLRVLALDRPGYGLSTPQPGRRLLDFPDDVLAFAAAQRLGHFGVLGASGGGPYALACARKLPPGALTHVGVMCGAGPFDAGAGARHIPRRSRATAFLARYWPAGLRALVAGLARGLEWVVRTRLVSGWIDQWIAGMDKKKAEAKAAKKAAKKAAAAAAVQKALPEDSVSEGSVVGEEFEEVAAAASVESISTVATKVGSSSKAAEEQEEEEEEADEDDSRKLTIPQRREKMFRALFSTFAQGAQPTVQEAILLAGDWGFRVEDIAFDPVVFWHGDRDANTPLPWVQPMIDRVPHAVLKVYPGKTHYSLAGELDEILAHFASPKAEEAAKAEDAEAAKEEAAQ